MESNIFTHWPKALSGLVPGVGHTNGRRAMADRNAVRELQQTWLAMAMHIIASKEDSAPLAFGMTSASPGEGKTTNCLGLGRALAREAGSKVIALECDLNSPGMAVNLDLNPQPGLVEHVTDGQPIEHVVQHTAQANLDIVVAGGQGSEDPERDFWAPSSLSRLTRGLPALVAHLKESYGYILLDLPPIITDIYAKEMINSTDGAFLVVRAGLTSLGSVARAAQDIRNGRFLGVVLAGGASPLPSWMVQLLSE